MLKYANIDTISYALYLACVVRHYNCSEDSTLPHGSEGFTKFKFVLVISYYKIKQYLGKLYVLKMLRLHDNLFDFCGVVSRF